MIARVAVSAALISGLFVISAPSASATCQPEKPSTCEPVTPHCHVSPWVDPGTLQVTAGLYCHGFE